MTLPDSTRPAGLTRLLLAGVAVFALLDLGLPLPSGWSLHEAGHDLTFWGVWALFVPLIVWATRRFPLGRAHAWQIGLVLVALALGTTYLAGSLSELQHVLVHHDKPFGAAVWDAFDDGLFESYGAHWAVFFALAGASLAPTVWQAMAERERRAGRLRAELADARLDALRMQLNPHFLFNALNTVSALVPHDAGATQEVVARLSALLRHTLDPPPGGRVPLAREVELLEHYLAVERVRFGERLTVRLDVGSEARAALVPDLILQPLVENAVKHGIGTTSAAGTVAVQAERWDDRLQIRIVNDAPQTRADAPQTGGVGLANTRERLHTRYGDAARLDARAHDGRWVVRLSLPFETAPSDPPTPPAP